MHELRKDYLLDDWVIIASGREKRPKLAEKKIMPSMDENCPFCPGNEERTPPEIARLPLGASEWRVRVVPNKFPAVEQAGEIEKLDLPFRFLKTAFGRHEVIIETPVHRLQMADFTIERIMEIVSVYAERVDVLEAVEGVKEVVLFKNQGPRAGASIPHSHSQLIALNKLSEKTKRELSAYNSFVAENHVCPFCRIISLEMDSQRRVWQNDSFACFAPFASRVPFQLAIYPKRHSPDFREMREKEKRDFAEILKKALSAVKLLGLDYNLYFKNAPLGIEDFHWHVCILPRMTTRAGFEEATDCIVNTHSPEFCAAFYREQFEKEATT